jgi:hypothetical protein
MTTNPGPIPIAFEFPRRRAIAPPAPRFSASFALLPLASASTASSSPPPEPPKRSPPNVQNVLRSPAAAFATHALAFKIKPTLRFPHTN